MLPYSIREFAEAINATVHGNTGQAEIASIFIDSRNTTIENTSVFFAIKGELNDGHKFITELHLKHCRYFVVEHLPDNAGAFAEDTTFFVVNNSKEALQKLAKNYRERFSPELITITGSNGKTITKEWLHFILSRHYSIIRSPKSYNSQVGVPLSIFMLKNSHQIAILEAGISRKGEMEKLEKMIQPQIGIFTNLGDAHQENFTSLYEKLEEKLSLFISCHTLIYNSDNQDVAMAIEAKFSDSKKLFSWSEHQKSKLRVQYTTQGSHTLIHYSFGTTTGKIQMPFTDTASRFNASTVLAYLFASGKMQEQAFLFKEQFKYLPTVEMRLEQSEGINGCSIINDSFNADIESVHIAIEFLKRQSSFKKKTLIISDLHQYGADKSYVYNKLVQVIINSAIQRVFAVGTEICPYLQEEAIEVNCYKDTATFINSFNPNNFHNEAILLKGARKFRFEQIASLLVSKTHRTVLEIKLPALKNNLLYFKKKLGSHTKLMIMVKAFSYGSGSGEIAHFLEHCKVDYLAVAFVDEGVELRQKGIELPIMVLSPSEHEFHTMIRHRLEPEIFSFESIHAFDSFLSGQNLKEKYPIHIKFDTGMHRVGFRPEQTNELCTFIQNTENCKIESIFTHLAGADSSEFDSYTLKQLRTFETLTSKIEQHFGRSFIKHALNSAGIERFNQYQFDMVRLGIGLYGISSTESQDLEHISTLKTKITQIKNLNAGESVGYSRKGRLTEDAKIATVPIGYADGYSRFFSNGKGKMLINGQKAPVIGNVCMDACMLDITGIDAEVGDEVIIFGATQTISELAESIGTIPYEILTSISSRVKRVYIEQ